jgi:hypothetical protein
MDSFRNELLAFQTSEWERLAHDAAALHAAFGHLLRGYRYLELIHERFVPTARRYKEQLAQLIDKMDPAFEGSAITYDEQMAGMYADMGDLLDIAHVDLETFYLFAKTVLERAAQYVEMYFGADPKLPLRPHEKLRANFEEYASRRGIVVPEGFVPALAQVHDFIYTHNSDSATNDAPQSPGDLMIAHTEERPGSNGSPAGVTLLSLTTGRLLSVVDAYLRAVVSLIRANPNLAAMLRKRKAGEGPAVETAAPPPVEPARIATPLEAPAAAG